MVASSDAIVYNQKDKVEAKIRETVPGARISSAAPVTLCVFTTPVGTGDAAKAVMTLDMRKGTSFKVENLRIVKNTRGGGYPEA